MSRNFERSRNPITPIRHYLSNRKDSDRTEQSLIHTNKILLTHSPLHKNSHNFGICLSSFHDPKQNQASLTMEAAVVLPLMLFLIFLLIFPLKVMEAERKLQNTMETVGKTLSITEYLQKVGEQAVKQESVRDFLINAADGIEEGTALAVILANTLNGPFSNTEFDQDTAVFSSGEGHDAAMFYAELKYDVAMPGLSYVLAPIRKSLVGR